LNSSCYRFLLFFYFFDIWLLLNRRNRTFLVINISNSRLLLRNYITFLFLRLLNICLYFITSCFLLLFHFLNCRLLNRSNHIFLFFYLYLRCLNLILLLLHFRLRFFYNIGLRFVIIDQWLTPWQRSLNGTLISFH
jgi:hypothetical protein